MKYISSKSFIELMKHDLFFNVYAEDKVSFELYTKYLKMDFPGLVGNHRALDRMNQIQEKFEYGLSNQFYVEMNDFPTGQFLSSFLDDNDNRIIDVFQVVACGTELCKAYSESSPSSRQTQKL